LKRVGALSRARRRTFARRETRRWTPSALAAVAAGAWIPSPLSSSRTRPSLKGEASVASTSPTSSRPPLKSSTTRT
jgi:hypothetical protein